MAFATAFQADAFQNNAFQVQTEAVVLEPTPTGIGAVVDTRHRDRVDEQWKRTQAERETRRRQAVEDAFEEVFGEPKPKVITSEERREVDQAVVRALQTAGMRQNIQDAARMVDEYMAAYVEAERLRKDEEALLALMVMV